MTEIEVKRESNWEALAQRVFTHLPPTVDERTYTEHLYHAVRANPQLARCAPLTIAATLMAAERLGLTPGIPNEFWLIPRKNKKAGGRLECTYIIGYAGLRKMVMRSGAYSHVHAHVVREKDEYRADLAAGHISHFVSFGERGKIIGAFAVATTHDGRRQIEQMSLADIEKVRKRSHAKSGPWFTDWERMAVKTVLRRLCYQLEMSSVDRRGLHAEEELITSVDIASPNDDGHPILSASTADLSLPAPDDTSNDAHPCIRCGDNDAVPGYAYCSGCAPTKRVSPSLAEWHPADAKLTDAQVASLAEDGIATVEELSNHLDGGGNVPRHRDIVGLARAARRDR